MARLPHPEKQTGRRVAPLPNGGDRKSAQFKELKRISDPADWTPLIGKRMLNEI